MFSGLFGKTEEPKEKLIRLIKKFEIDGTPLETAPQNNSMGVSAASGYATVVKDPEADEYFNLKNEFAVDLLTHRSTYNIPQDKYRYFFAEVAQNTVNGRKFMEDNKYGTFDAVSQTGGERNKKKTKNKKMKKTKNKKTKNK
jgi:hypothetical protein